MQFLFSQASMFLLVSFPKIFQFCFVLLQLLCNKLPQIQCLKQTNLQFCGQKSEMSLTGLKSRCWAGLCSFYRVQGRIPSLPFPVSRSCPLSLAHLPPLITPIWPFSSLALTLPPSFYKDTCDYPGLTWIIRIISSSQNP